MNPLKLKVEGKSDSGFILIINERWLQNNPLTVYSLNEEISQWGKFGIHIKLKS